MLKPGAASKCVAHLESHCDWAHDNDKREKTNMNEGQKHQGLQRVTDCAANVMCVLAFLTSGDGGTEASRLLGLLGMPNDTTIAGNAFSKVEEHIGPSIRQLAKDAVKENLIEEVRLGMVAHGNWNEATFNKWKSSLDDPSVTLTKEERAVVEGSYDHAWQQKGTGHTHDSLSGHGCIFGGHTS